MAGFWFWGSLQKIWRGFRFRTRPRMTCPACANACTAAATHHGDDCVAGYCDILTQPVSWSSVGSVTKTRGGRTLESECWLDTACHCHKCLGAPDCTPSDNRILNHCVTVVDMHFSRPSSSMHSAGAVKTKELCTSTAATYRWRLPVCPTRTLLCQSVLASPDRSETLTLVVQPLVPPVIDIL